MWEKAEAYEEWVRVVEAAAQVRTPCVCVCAPSEGSGGRRSGAPPVCVCVHLQRAVEAAAQRAVEAAAQVRPVCVCVHLQRAGVLTPFLTRCWHPIRSLPLARC
eukprot:480361-Prorocentrum_minimum.AAC.1